MFPRIFNILLEALADVEGRKEIKAHRSKRKKRNLFIENGIVYVENPKEFTKRLPEVRSEFSEASI